MRTVFSRSAAILVVAALLACVAIPGCTAWDKSLPTPEQLKVQGFISENADTEARYNFMTRLVEAMTR